MTPNCSKIGLETKAAAAPSKATPANEPLEMPKTSTTIESRSSKPPQIPPAISYRLSDKFFIDNGWTVKPNSSLALRVVIMKAKFSHPTISPWFQERSEDLKMRYADGGILCIAQTDGAGQIFYPNGNLAINIEKGGINNFRTRVWVYSHGDVDSDGKRYPAQLCALFDSLGNGVVYGCHMEKRLVFNQKEGILWDSPTGIPISWKWHNINLNESLSLMNEEDELDRLLLEPPQPVLWATPVDKNPEMEHKDSTKKNSIASFLLPSPALTKSEINFLEAAEHSRYVDTEKTLPKDVSPLKPIVLRLNKYLALRILSQSNVSLSFNAKGRQTSLKIGVLYNPYNKLKVVEIENPAETTEKVICSFEDFPPKTESMLNFRMTVEAIRKGS